MEAQLSWDSGITYDRANDATGVVILELHKGLQLGIGELPVIIVTRC